MRTPRLRSGILFGMILSAASAPSAAEDFSDESLQALLDEQTRIATRTLLNADYVPGIVTVLQGNDLETRGIHTVWEAMNLVPGVQTVIYQDGTLRLVIRGIGKSYGSGFVKVMLNGIAMNAAHQALAEPVLNLPIGQVKRIEVIRGPGSAIHGEFAFSGVVNVVTYVDRSRSFARAGSFGTKALGAQDYWESNGGWKLSLSATGWQTDGPGVKVDQDGYYAEETPELSNAPGPANDKRYSHMAIADLNKGGFRLLAQFTEDGSGDHFGINNHLPPEKRIVQKTTQQMAEASWRWGSTGSEYRVAFGVNLMSRTKDELYASSPDDPTPTSPIDPTPLVTTYGYLTDVTYREQRRYGLAQGNWHSAKHNFLFAAEGAHIGVLDSEQIWIRPDGTTTTTDYLATPGMDRSVASATIQDEYRASDVLAVTAGIRHDRYSDVGDNTAPRIAGVWRLSPKHIVKAQYAEAFRPPSFYELGLAERLGVTLEPSRVLTLDAAYLFKGNSVDTRVTLFGSFIPDLVYLDRLTYAYRNRTARTIGLELDGSWQLHRTWRVEGNLALVDARDQDGEPIPGSSDGLANLGLIYDSHPVAFAAQAHHVNRFFRESADPRPPLSGYTSVDLAATWASGVPGLGLAVGLKNALDTDIRLPSVLDVSGGIIVPYPDDLPRAGRSWWLELSYEY